jgi:hypothetical protein
VPKISREAPLVGGNEGGSIEIVFPVNGVQLESFLTIKFYHYGLDKKVSGYKKCINREWFL